jgi:hypothetical protein
VLLDEVRIFNKSLTTANISSLTDRSEGGTMLQTANVGNVFEQTWRIVVSSADYRYNNFCISIYCKSYRSTVTIHEFSTIAKV